MPSEPRRARSLSQADRVALLSDADRTEFLAHFTPKQLAALATTWEFWSRPEQRLPLGDWINWLILAGRGFGKTRTGAETVREWIKDGFRYVNLIGATFEDVEDIMVKGESGILAICPKDERPRWVKNELRWPNGAISLVFSAEEPDRLRGKQHDKLWCDELAAWRYPDAWDQASFGLRLGRKPQAVITTTPRPTPIVKALMADETTRITRGSTYDNLANLADAFTKKIVAKYEGTRLGRQELEAQILDDVPGALWTAEMLERATRKRALPEFSRVVIALDPSVSNNEGSDEFGIVAVALGRDGHGYVLEDASAHYSVTEWPAKAIGLYRKYKADRVIGEVNNGGDMIEATLRMVDPSVAFSAVHATRGKVVRAEPVSALYSRGLIHHIGSHAKLEDQMLSFTADFDRKKAKYSPDRVDALVWGITELKIADTTGGFLDYYDNLNQAAKAAREAELHGDAGRQNHGAKPVEPAGDWPLG